MFQEGLRTEGYSLILVKSVVLNPFMLKSNYSGNCYLDLTVIILTITWE